MAPHPKARQLARSGGIRTRRPVIPVPRPPDPRQTDPHRGNRHLGARPQRQPHQGQLALLNIQRARQTQASLSFNLNESGDYEAKGFGALKGQMVKKAALSRVFGFEIMPAPFVVAHLQVGLTLRAMGVTLDSNTERAGVFLTNALTGWEP